MLCYVDFSRENTLTVRRRRKKINITNRKSKSKSKYGWTYFLVNEKARAVKIGKTTQRLDKRLHSLSTQNPHDQFDYRDYRFAFAFDDAKIRKQTFINTLLFIGQALSSPK